MTELIEQNPQAMQVAQPAQDVSPSGLLAMVIQRGASLEQIAQMLDFQERMEATAARKAYNEAFAAFKAEAVRIIKNRSVTDGPLKGKKYAELFAVVNAVTPALSMHGLSASWRITKDDRDWIEVTCSLRHVGGHSESVSMGGPPDTGGAKNAIMARASAVSYLERYTLKAICGLSEQEDDNDGAGYGGHSPSTNDGGLLDAGRDASMKGMAELTEWWGSLTPKQRNALAKDFGSMRKAAQAADAEGK